MQVIGDLCFQEIAGFASPAAMQCNVLGRCFQLLEPTESLKSTFPGVAPGMQLSPKPCDTHDQLAPLQCFNHY